MKRIKGFCDVFVADILDNLPGFIDKSRTFRSTLRQNADPKEIAAQFEPIYDDWQKAVRTAKNVWVDLRRNPRQARPDIRRRLCRYLVRFLWNTQGIRRLKNQLEAVGCDENKLRAWKQAYDRKYPAMMAAAKNLADYVDAYTDLRFSNVRYGSVYASPARMGRNRQITSENRNYPFNYADDEAN